MRPEQVTPAAVWQEFERARAFNHAIGLYGTVEQNEDFYIGNQWRGVNAPDLDKPVMNVLARVVKFFISSIVSDDIGVSVTDFDEDEAMKPVLEMLGGQFDEIMELSQFKKKMREVIRNAAVDGDGCLHYWFDPDGGPEDPRGGTRGVIRAEILENTNVYFGNPQRAEVQEQPYLLLHFRRLVNEVRARAQDPEAVEPDEDEAKHGDAPEEGKVTVVRRYWMQEPGAPADGPEGVTGDGHKTVWYTEVTRGAVVTPPTDTGLERYPVAFMPWEKVKNQYHGQAAITGLIPNQIFINKLFAMSMQHVKRMAFPKVIYNRAIMPGGWDNRVGAAIPVSGDPNMAVASNFRAQDMSAQVLQMIEAVINYTRDTMGASDAALGNVRPDNTSAIVATQKATSMPLELQKQDFYSFVEDSVRIWMDMMCTYYGVRTVRLQAPKAEVMQGAAPQQPGGPALPPMGGGETETRLELFDFASLRDLHLRLNVDIGAATYWSELMQVQTLDNLFARGILQDAEVYLENMPRGYVPGKADLIKAIRAQKEQAQAAAQAQMMDGAAAVPEAALLKGAVQG